MTTTLGTDFSCFDDFDGLFSVALSDEYMALDELHHRFTTDAVVADDDVAGLDWGFDLRRLLGAPMTDADIAALGPQLAVVAQKSAMIDFADVTATRIGSTPLVLQIDVVGKSITGTDFAFVFTLSAATFLQVGTTDQ